MGFSPDLEQHGENPKGVAGPRGDQDPYVDKLMAGSPGCGLTRQGGTQVCLSPARAKKWILKARME